jgi:hypothetical protein
MAASDQGDFQMFEIFNTDLLRSGGEAHAEQLRATMRASRSARVGERVRHWAGRELVRAGQALGADTSATGHRHHGHQATAR